MVRRTVALALAFGLGGGVMACGKDDRSATNTALHTTPTGTTPTPFDGPFATPTGVRARAVETAFLRGGRFVATASDGRKLVELQRVELNFESGSLAANSGCNRFVGASWVVSSGRLFVKRPVGRTLARCTAADMAQEEWFLGWLASGPSAIVEGASLTLASEGVTVDFTAEQLPDDKNPPLAGTEWSLERVEGPGGRSTGVPPEPAPPSFTIDASGDLSIFTGCNSGGGPVRVRGTRSIEFGAIRTTMMACLGDNFEETVLDTLQGKVSSGFDSEQRLVLSRRGTKLIFRAR